eukprot:TRINITY_DN26808_c0_g2_i1.p1 TRINITY_DN26808_c0_g2~~TRINITY_DN26808_c0_g2_i1.p1  ORF type:complete len:302 (+),score=27.82 TRINITY_DN26808_c0_g2_i1:70-975(+)
MALLATAAVALPFVSGVIYRCEPECRPSWCDPAWTLEGSCWGQPDMLREYIAYYQQAEPASCKEGSPLFTGRSHDAAAMDSKFHNAHEVVCCNCAGGGLGEAVVGFADAFEAFGPGFYDALPGPLTIAGPSAYACTLDCPARWQVPGSGGADSHECHGTLGEIRTFDNKGFELLLDSSAASACPCASGQPHLLTQICAADGVRRGALLEYGSCETIPDNTMVQFVCCSSLDSNAHTQPGDIVGHSCDFELPGEVTAAIGGGIAAVCCLCICLCICIGRKCRTKKKADRGDGSQAKLGIGIG